MGLIDWLFGKITRMGVYAIVNKVDGKLYVGSSKDLRAHKRITSPPYWVGHTSGRG